AHQPADGEDRKGRGARFHHVRRGSQGLRHGGRDHREAPLDGRGRSCSKRLVAKSRPGFPGGRERVESGPSSFQGRKVTGGLQTGEETYTRRGSALLVLP